MFAVPHSSPSPSTPDKGSSKIGDPSTTPLVPPPSERTAYSFTPKGLPPPSVFSSSYNFTARSFGKSPAEGTLHGRFGANNGTSTRSGTFTLPNSSPFREDHELYGDGDQDMTDDMTGLATAHGGGPRGLKRSRRGEPMSDALVPPTLSAMAKGHDESTISGIAKSMTTRNRSTTLSESDDLILTTENILGRIFQELQNGRRSSQHTVTRLIDDLTFAWSSYVSPSTVPGGIGPADKASVLAKANYLSNLLLQMHHPQQEQAQNLPMSGFGRASSRGSTSLPSTDGFRQMPIPKALLSWLNKYHTPFPSELEDLSKCLPSSTAHEAFWDILFANTLRGHLVKVAQLLREADFSHAKTALDDGYRTPGYRGEQLESIRQVIEQAIQVLRACPAIQSGNWDIKGNEWSLFRRNVEQALIDLEEFAEGESHDRDEAGSSLSTSRNQEFTLSTASRRAESRVPWTIYENLKTFYGQLRGSPAEITLASQDWVEASIFLTVWWDGEEGQTLKSSFSQSRRAFTRPQVREVDIHPVQAYQERLRSSFLQVTKAPEDPQLTVNTSSSVQIGLACVFEGNIEEAVKLVSDWSMALASAMIEIGGLAGWLPEARPTSAHMMDDFDESDLMVLSYGQRPQQQPSPSLSWKPDDISIRYADLLAQKPNIWSADKHTQREGWELAVQVLSRLDDRQTATQHLSTMLAHLPLDNADRVDKILNLCTRLGLSSPARNIALNYAEHLHATTSNYGGALQYYARAHATTKLKEVLDLLIAYSLTHSSAFPSAKDLDWRLRAFLHSPRESLAQLANIDDQAAQLLSMYLSGYATLRKFYDLRDEEVEGKRSELRPRERQRRAAEALIAVIESARENVRGGLYDPEAGAIVQVDALLALLGEALVFVNQPARILTTPQLMVLLYAAEDLQTCPSRIYGSANECLRASLSQFLDGASAPLPRQIVLRKSTSNVSSLFSMIGSEMLGSREVERSRDERSSEGSGVLVMGDIRRGWDWRRGLKEGTEGEALLRLLRMGVAEEMAKAWLEAGE
ncbi:MAG: hypothetical protein M1820_010632 [Bogoriella megaspora]|nr:MAG: hypothetical protein M1820_010632 [Bogoriella megaspora]